MAIIPHKACELAFGLQIAQGVPANPDIMFPIHEAEDLDWQKNYSFFQYSDGYYDLRHYFSEGQWLEGAITFPLIPGVVAGNLGTWLWGRTGTYRQGYWATIYRNMGNGVVERYVDCKALSGSFAWDYGALSTIVVNVAGITAPEATGAFGATIYTADPYLYNEVGLALALGGGAYASYTPTKNHAIEWDNMVEAPADMGTLSGSITPLHLPEAATAQWTASFDQLFLTSEIYDDFHAGQEGSYRAILARPAISATCTLTFPRIVWTEAPLHIPNSGVVWQEGVNFQALGSRDGATAAFTLTETI